jgi:hypothetical protein
MNKSIEIILKEMCKRVGADYNTIDFQKERWYIKHSWTEKDRTSFHKWLSNLVFTNKDVRNEIMERPYKNKKYADKVANEFIFNYGWQVKE